MRLPNAGRRLLPVQLERPALVEAMALPETQRRKLAAAWWRKAEGRLNFDRYDGPITARALRRLARRACLAEAEG